MRANGTVAKVNLALGGLPTFPALTDAIAPDGFIKALSGRIHIGPEIDYLERAFDASKYGEFSSSPYLDVTIPTLLDPALAPEGKHVLSAYVQFAPFKLSAPSADGKTSVKSESNWQGPAPRPGRHSGQNSVRVRT